jgi:hypothetical protein
LAEPTLVRTHPVPYVPAILAPLNLYVPAVVIFVLPLSPPQLANNKDIDTRNPTTIFIFTPSISY